MKMRWSGTDVKVGDTVIRMLAGTIPQTMRITALTETKVTCALWDFDRATGAEIDEDLDFGPPPKMTGSFLILPELED